MALESYPFGKKKTPKQTIIDIFYFLITKGDGNKTWREMFDKIGQIRRPNRLLLPIKGVNLSGHYYSAAQRSPLLGSPLGVSLGLLLHSCRKIRFCSHSRTIWIYGKRQQTHTEMFQKEKKKQKRRHNNSCLKVDPEWCGFFVPQSAYS